MRILTSVHRPSALALPGSRGSALCPAVRRGSWLWAACALTLTAACADPAASTPATSSPWTPPEDGAVDAGLPVPEVPWDPNVDPPDPAQPTPDAVPDSQLPDDAVTPPGDSGGPGPSDGDPGGGPPTDADPSDGGEADVPATGGPGLVPRSCLHRFTFDPLGQPVSQVAVPGAFNGWDTAALPMAPQDDGTWAAELDMSGIEPGSYGYKLFFGGDDWRLDPAEKRKRFDDGFVNSKIVVPDCTRPELTVLERTVDPVAGTAVVEVQVHPGVGGELDLETTPPSATHAFEDVPGAWDADRGTLRVELSGLPKGKHTLIFRAASASGEAVPRMVSFWVEDAPFDWRDAVLYFAFVDRFRDGDPSLGQPLSCTWADSPGNWKGGDWKGLQDAIEEGYFDELGVNALWINGPMDNPEACVDGLYDKVYSSYHGYFPSDLYAAETEHFGSMQDLRDLVHAAHERGIRVLVDLTANHLHTEATEYSQFLDQGWFNELHVCGWEQPETCWFQDYLPDLNYRNDDVVEYMAEVGVWWAREADLDGFRVDAVKHLHPHFLNTLRARLDEEVEATSDGIFWTVGETFTGPWSGGGGPDTEEALIKAYISDDQLYGQFDFPLFWSLLSALGRHESSVSDLASILQQTVPYYGPDAVMASFLGNHDVSRFVSHANGDIGDLWGNGSTPQGWENPPGQPGADEPYARLEQAFTFLAGIPMVPLVYYGDEIGIAGAGDPDNRRVMPWEGLSTRQEAVRTHTGNVMRARLASPALRRGGMSVLHADADAMIVLRAMPDGSDTAVMAVNRATGEATHTVGLPAGLTFVDAVDGSTHDSGSGTMALTIPARGSRLLVRQGLLATP